MEIPLLFEIRLMETSPLNRDKLWNTCVASQTTIYMKGPPRVFLTLLPLKSSLSPLPSLQRATIIPTQIHTSRPHQLGLFFHYLCFLSPPPWIQPILWFVPPYDLRRCHQLRSIVLCLCGDLGRSRELQRRATIMVAVRRGRGGRWR